MFENKTYNNIKNEILNNINLDLAKNEGSFLNELVSGTSLKHANFYVVLEKILNIAFINDSFDENLDKRVAEFGIERKHGIKATGYLTFAGVDGTVIPRETLIYYGNLKYYVMSIEEETEITDGSARIIVQAENAGSEYNLLSSAELTHDIEGVTKITGYSSYTLGTNEETDDELKRRFFYTRTNKGTSGNIDDYIDWALEVDGVKNVKVIPLWNGNGTVKVILMTENNRSVDISVVNNAKEYIESKRPVGARVTVTTPTVLEVDISATLELEKEIDIDAVKSNLQSAVDLYLVNATKEITYTKIAGVLSSIEGVIDYKDLLINGESKNIKLTSEQIGSVGIITLSKGEVE